MKRCHTNAVMGSFNMYVLGSVCHIFLDAEDSLGLSYLIGVVNSDSSSRYL